MNLSTKQTQIYRLREWTDGCQGEGWEEGIIREFGMDIYTLLYLKRATNEDLLYQLNVRWQPGWEGGLGENGYMYTYGWVPSLSTWNYHDTVSQLYSNIKLKDKKLINKIWVPGLKPSQRWLLSQVSKKKGGEREKDCVHTLLYFASFFPCLSHQTLPLPIPWGNICTGHKH